MTSSILGIGLMLSAVLVRDVMSKNVKTVKPDSKLREVLEKMVKFNISSVIVISRDRPIGIVTERDFLKSIAGPVLDLDVMEAKNVMSMPLVTVDEDADIEEASRLMLKNKIKKLAVVKGDSLAGVITSSDIVRGTNMLAGTLKDVSMIGKSSPNR